MKYLNNLEEETNEIVKNKKTKEEEEGCRNKKETFIKK